MEMKRGAAADLDVLCVRSLQFLSEVRIRLQNLDHLSEVPVVVQACVLRGAHREARINSRQTTF